MTFFAGLATLEAMQATHTTQTARLMAQPADVRAKARSVIDAVIWHARIEAEAAQARVNAANEHFTDLLGFGDETCE